MRTDLKMSKGKMCAQAAHASVKVTLDNVKKLKDTKSAFYSWANSGFAKVCLKVGSEEELKSIYDRAIYLGLPAALIMDAGRTTFNGVPTLTCLAIGPCLPKDINPITFELKLL